MERTATALMLATVLVAAGLSATPAVLADHGDCHKDFAIPSSKPSLTDARPLLAGESEVGHTSVMASDADKQLNVRLDTEGILEWTVFVENSDGDCLQYTSSDCDIDGAYPNVLDKADTTQSCTIESPSSGSEDYWVLFENAGDSLLDYRTWAE